MGTSAGASVTNIAGNVENHINFGPGIIGLYPNFVVPDAGYQSSGTRSSCLAGTREAVIRKISKWKDDINASPICWVSGAAGFGKSAISQTVAESCATDGTLVASFFFLRGAGGRSEFDRLITTLAFQMTLSVPETKPIIEKTLQDDPTILHQSIANRLQKLVLSPMMSITAANPPNSQHIIVIDGLDECNDERAIQNFIAALASAGSSGTLPFRWLLASRREGHIQQAFADNKAQANTAVITLEHFDAAVDIAKFLKHSFSIILERNPRLVKGVRLPWPSNEDLQALDRKSDGLFIFASTLVDFITDGKGAPPEQKLKIVLNLHAGLDPLYEQVLRAVPEIDCFRAVLTTLMLVRKQPSIKLLADLLQLGTRDVLHALMAIQSIIHIPNDDNTPIRLNHTSLRDFLINKNRSNDLFIDPPTADLILAVKCVKLMNRTLRQDEFPADAAPAYAAQYWLLHLGDSRVSSEVSSGMLSVLTDFCSSEIFSFAFNVIARNIGKYQESIAALARSLVYYMQINGSGAIVFVLRKIKTELEVNSLIAPI